MDYVERGTNPRYEKIRFKENKESQLAHGHRYPFFKIPWLLQTELR